MDDTLKPNYFRYSGTHLQPCLPYLWHVTSVEEILGAEVLGYMSPSASRNGTWSRKNYQRRREDLFLQLLRTLTRLSVGSLRGKILQRWTRKLLMITMIQLWRLASFVEGKEINTNLGGYFILHLQNLPTEGPWVSQESLHWRKPNAEAERSWLYSSDEG